MTPLTPVIDGVPDIVDGVPGLVDIFLNTLTRLISNCNAVTRNAKGAGHPAIQEKILLRD